MSTNAAKIGFSNFSYLEEITSEIFPTRREQAMEIRIFTLKNEFNHKKEILCPELFSSTRIDFPCQF